MRRLVASALFAVFLALPAVGLDAAPGDTIQIVYGDGTHGSCVEAQCVCDVWTANIFWSDGTGPPWGSYRAKSVADLRAQEQTDHDEAYASDPSGRLYERQYSKTDGPTCNVNGNNPATTQQLNADQDAGRPQVWAAAVADAWTRRLATALNVIKGATKGRFLDFALGRGNAFAPGVLLMQYGSDFKTAMQKLGDLRAAAKDPSRSGDITKLVNDLNGIGARMDQTAAQLLSPPSGASSCLLPSAGGRDLLAQNVPWCGQFNPSILSNQDPNQLASIAMPDSFTGTPAQTLGALDTTMDSARANFNKQLALVFLTGSPSDDGQKLSVADTVVTLLKSYLNVLDAYAGTRYNVTALQQPISANIQNIAQIRTNVQTAYTAQRQYLASPQGRQQLAVYATHPAPRPALLSNAPAVQRTVSTPYRPPAAPAAPSCPSDWQDEANTLEQTQLPALQQVAQMYRQLPNASIPEQVRSQYDSAIDEAIKEVQEWAPCAPQRAANDISRLNSVRI